MTTYFTNSKNNYLSNYYKVKFKDYFFSNLIFPSVEHYYESMKYFITKSNNWINHINNIIKIKNPKDVKLYTKAYPYNCHTFCENKNSIMKKGLYLKFSQNENLKKKLKKNNNKLIAKINDNYWGIETDRKGKNILGILLEELRNEL